MPIWREDKELSKYNKYKVKMDSMKIGKVASVLALLARWGSVEGSCTHSRPLTCVCVGFACVFRRRESRVVTVVTPAPNVNVERLCALVMYMVSGNTLLSNSGILKVPLDGDKQWVRPLGPHYNNSNWTPWTMSQEVSPTPLLPPLRRMWKRCARKGEQT